MKKVLIVVVCLLMVGSAFALESAPSNKVGYVKIVCGAVSGGVGSTPFGLPFTFWEVPTGSIPTYGDTTQLPSMIVGTQAKCSTATRADAIMKQGSGAVARRVLSSCAWSGTLESSADMGPGFAYYYQNRTGVQRNLVLAGEADTTAAGIPDRTITNGSGNPSTSYSWKDPRELPRNKLNLLEEGFLGGGATTGDRVIAQTAGAGGGIGTYFTYLTSSSTWSGTLASVSPGGAYYIQNRHAANAWTYQYRANGNPIIAPPPSSGDISKTPAARTDVVKGTASSTSTKQATPSTNVKK